MKKPGIFLTYLVVIAAVMAWVLAAPSPAVRLKPGDDEGAGEVRPRPRPEPPNSVVRYLSRVRIQGPYSDRGLTVYTLTTHAPESAYNYLTLDEGIASGQILIQEIKDGSVPTLQLRNVSRRWAFLMNGELVKGGKQNRTVRSDMLVPPNGTAWVNLPVFCVEQGRWRGVSGKFSAGKAFAPNSVRAGLNQGYDQAETWRKVGEANKAAGVRTATGDVTVIYSDAKTRKKIDEITSRLIRCIPRKQYVGLVIAHGRRIVSADLFANAQLYANLYEKVIRSHAAEVFYRRHTGSPTHAEVRAFLNRIHGASLTRRPAPGGHGTLIRISGNRLGGEALEYGGRCIHVALFPQIVRPVPVPIPRPPRPPVPLPHPERRR